MIRARMLVIAIVALATSCSRPRTAPRAVGIELTPVSADVWAPEVQVGVYGPVPDELTDCEVVGESGSTRLERAGSGQQASSGRAAAFVGRVALEPGKHSYRARCRSASNRAFDSAPVAYTLMLPDAPRAQIVARLQGQTLVLDGTGSERSSISHSLPSRFDWRLLPGLGREPRALGTGTSIELAPPGQDGDYVYELTVSDDRGHSDTGRALIRVRGGRFALSPSEPAWIASAVVYGVIPPLFGRERPLMALRAALPSIAELGVTAIWISPLFAAAKGDFGYAVTDYFEVRSDFGTEQDLQALVSTAHQLGVRVLLDFVPNHTSREHRYFQQAEALGGKSHYYGFYERDRSGNPTHYFDWDHLPNLAFSNGEVANWITRGAAFWLEHAAVDGYRVDAAWAIRERKPAFYSGLMRELRRVRPDALLIAEASAHDAFFLEHGFDAAYDWTSEPGKWAWQGVFEERSGIARRLSSALAQTDARAANPARVFRFLNNNDTGKRFITRYGLPLTRVATVLLLTLPGIPCIYAFDESGGEYEPYEELVAHAGSQPQLRDFHRELIALRRSHDALHASGMSVLRAEPAAEVFAFVRSSADADAATVLVVLNFGEAPWAGSVELGPGTTRNATFRAILGASRGATLNSAKGQARLQLPAYGYALFASD